MKKYPEILARYGGNDGESGMKRGFRYPMAHQFATLRSPTMYRILSKEPPPDYRQTNQEMKSKIEDRSE